MPDRLKCTRSRTPEGLSEGPQVSKAKPTAPQAEGERRWVPDQRAKSPGESHPPPPRPLDGQKVHETGMKQATEVS